MQLENKHATSVQFRLSDGSVVRIAEYFRKSLPSIYTQSYYKKVSTKLHDNLVTNCTEIKVIIFHFKLYSQGIMKQRIFLHKFLHEMLYKI